MPWPKRLRSDLVQESLDAINAYLSYRESEPHSRYQYLAYDPFGMEKVRLAERVKEALRRSGPIYLNGEIIAAPEPDRIDIAFTVQPAR